ncbi:hypothetical protein SODALDRAFT_359155 [Sodiomyces alkalinus F11]|uniref:Uncharacterized protein n=1 Tax=Sodiomyces alkalinus (strain CBS 110278 / VKM F-3762 / F11) TaxID=1314773 RepID=A0A3N2PXQ3_SODAK|nr:hypothetical protein SODALDRAFT_359155 [Sodiomyces alkalinus F11]ROT39277.1 hypothetical protein SODALDRAFT_359155 [Sodiomyces alkalinus F11]
MTSLKTFPLANTQHPPNLFFLLRTLYAARYLVCLLEETNKSVRRNIPLIKTTRKAPGPSGAAGVVGRLKIYKETIRSTNVVGVAFGVVLVRLGSSFPAELRFLHHRIDFMRPVYHPNRARLATSVPRRCDPQPPFQPLSLSASQPLSLLTFLLGLKGPQDKTALPRCCLLSIIFGPAPCSPGLGLIIEIYGTTASSPCRLSCCSILNTTI